MSGLDQGWSMGHNMQLEVITVWNMHIYGGIIHAIKGHISMQYKYTVEVHMQDSCS